MAKEDSTNFWQNLYPSAIVSRRVLGDATVAVRYNGEAKALLYQVKNAMQFNRLRSLQGVRVLEDGTRITCSSIFGQDIITIDTRNTITVLGGCQCKLTLLNVPVAVPPMMHPGHIHVYGDEAFTEGFGIGKSSRWGPDEILNQDYQKTYYLFEQRGICPAPDWNMSDTAEMRFGYGVSQDNPFIFTDPPGYEISHIIVPPDTDNHCVWSFSGCNAEIIESGTDEVGQYIIWKAYTEWSSVNLYSVLFSRTGFGYMKLEVFVKDAANKTLCTANSVVRVDCCQKPSDDRIVNLYWEFLPGWPWNCINQPWFFWGTSQWCEVPTEMNFWYMARIATFYGFFVNTLPELKGSCIPIEWTLQGPGKINPSGTGFELCEWKLPVDFSYEHPSADEACVDVIITGTDRCGNSKRIVGSCCKYGGCDDMDILYTALAVNCSSSQELMASCGCPPFTWTCSSGTLSGALDSGMVTWTAPVSNPDCADHPVVTAKDCCGKTASITFSVSCWSVVGTAMGFTDFAPCGCRHYDNPNICGFAYWGHGSWSTGSYDCSGAISATCGPTTGCEEPLYWPDCGGYTDGGVGCWPDMPGSCWTNECACGCATNCTCNEMVDCRTAQMKLDGCCPINPLTGLPL